MKYVTGDLFSHPTLRSNLGPSRTYICHIVNSIGAWGSGFVIPLGKKYPESREEYLKYYKDYNLGGCQVIDVNKDLNILVVNMFAQDGISNYAKTVNVKPFQYGHFAECLVVLRKHLHSRDEILMPLVGAGLGGGNWDIIEEIIENIIGDYNVTIYQLPGQEVR